MSARRNYSSYSKYTYDPSTQGNLSVPTTRLLKVILPGSCLWTSLRESEGLTFEKTVKELKSLYPPSEDDDLADGPHGLSYSVPEAIISMVTHQGAMEALGSMIWCVDHY